MRKGALRALSVSPYRLKGCSVVYAYCEFSEQEMQYFRHLEYKYAFLAIHIAHMPMPCEKPKTCSNHPNVAFGARQQVHRASDPDARGA